MEKKVVKPWDKSEPENAVNAREGQGDIHKPNSG